MASDDLTAEYVRSLLDYDPATGIFRWRGVGVLKKRGEIAGYQAKNGYIYIGIGPKKIYLAHRLAWLVTYGSWPRVIDHKDRNTSNNSIDNLRDAGFAFNAQNRTKAQSRSKTGILGVFPVKGTQRFAAKLRVGGRIVSHKEFRSLDDARVAYLEAKRRYHPGFIE